MSDSTPSDRPLNILHVFRAPLGGLFRHVLDLCREQMRLGHRVGILADSLTGGPNASTILMELAPNLQLGLRRIPMRRNPHPSDIAPLRLLSGWCKEDRVDVLHGHGAKGGAYVRFHAFGSGRSGPIRVYTPHGGSLNHRPGTLTHRVYMQVERAMAARSDLLLFESGYISGRFDKLVGPPPHLFRVVRNGIADSEFLPVAPKADASDFLYVGELRAAKGIDTLLEALASAGRTLGFQPRALLVGTGPDRDALQRHAEHLGLASSVSFAGSLPARDAFSRGKVLIVPSRSESLPYIVLEAAGARIPLIATEVGGIPEIFGPYKGRLIPADRIDLLAARMIEMISAAPEDLAQSAQDLAGYVQTRFSLEAMAEGIVGAYREALHLRRGNNPALAPNPLISLFERGPGT